MIRHISIVVFSILCFLKIHTIDNVWLDAIVLVLSIIAALKKFYNLSFFVILIWLISPHIWLLFCNILRNKLLHYSLISDVLSITFVSLLLNYITFKSISKTKCYLLFLIGIIILIYPYLPYEKYIYWITILLIPVISTSIYRTDNIQKSSNKYWLFFGILIILTSLYNNLYHKKINSIAILKSQWCDVSKEVNNDSYSMDYFYAYSDFLRLLNSYAPASIITNNDISNNNLNFDAIVLITPTTPFSPKNIDNLLNYVWKGGKLIIIADHTNLYGHADVLNTLLHRLSTHINDDTLYDNIDYYKDYHINIKSLQLNKMYTKTNSSIDIPFYSHVWGISDTIISEKADYTKENFFGSLAFTEDDSVGSFVVGATLNYGLGDVVIWTDSTLFSNFAISQKNHLYLLDFLITGKVIDDNIRQTSYKKLNIVSSNEMLREAPPGHEPHFNQYSTLVANFTRNNILPVYNAFSNNIKQLYILTYAEFLNNIDKFNNGEYYVIIVDDIPSNNIFNVKKFDMFQKNEVSVCNDFCFYSVDGSKITTKYKQIHVLFGKNTISDKELGTWWNTMPISPYKKYMLNSINQWISNAENISFYEYPSNNNIFKDIIITYDNSEKKKVKEMKISSSIIEGDNSFVYLGNRQWGILLDKNTILGGMETVDNIENAKDLRKWTIKLSE